MKKDVFQGKKCMYPVCTDRFIFPVFHNEKLISIKYKVEQISQVHRDILDAIAIAGKKGKYRGDHNRIAIIFSLPDVLRLLGHKHINNHAWLIKKLKDLFSTKIEVEYKFQSGKQVMISNILQRVAYSEKFIRENHKKNLFGEGKLFLVVFSEEFTDLIKQDYIVFARPEIVKAILGIPKRHEFLKILVRYILTHEQINMKLTDLIKRMNLQINERLLKKYKQQIKSHAEYLEQNFAIKVVSKNNELYIFYKKDKNKIAIDFNKEPIPIEIKQFEKAFDKAIEAAKNLKNQRD